MLVTLGRDAEDDIEGVVDAVRAADGRHGFHTTITGEFTLDADFSTLADQTLRNGELGFGLPAALIVLLIVFGLAVDELIPLLLAIVSITVALALTALVGQAFPLSVFATNMLTGMGLALGIDYSLFILSRYREERGRRRPDPDAGAARPARRPGQRAADSGPRGKRRPPRKPLLVADRSERDDAPAPQPCARHRGAARPGRAGARHAHRGGRRRDPARSACRQAGLRRPQRRVSRRDHRTRRDRHRPRPRLIARPR